MPSRSRPLLCFVPKDVSHRNKTFDGQYAGGLRRQECPVPAPGLRSACFWPKDFYLLHKTFETVLLSTAEQKEYILLERIELELFPDDHGKTIDPFAEVCFPTCYIDLPETGQPTQHGMIASFRRERILSEASLLTSMTVFPLRIRRATPEEGTGT